jgi:hypothetical protein
VTFFGAHVHSTDNETAWGKPTVDRRVNRKGWHEYCVGGGGGWACDALQGVVAGAVTASGRVVDLRFIMASYDGGRFSHYGGGRLFFEVVASARRSCQPTNVFYPHRISIPFSYCTYTAL